MIENGEVIATGATRNEKHDFNDFLIFKLKPMQTYNLIAELNGNKTEKTITTDSSKFQIVEMFLRD